MSLSRRSFLQASGVALAAGALPFKAEASGSQPALPVPPLLESRRGQPCFSLCSQPTGRFWAVPKPRSGGLTACISGRR